MTWRNSLQTISLFEGDSYGTSVDDFYIDADAQGTNFNGAGLNSKWSSGGGDGERPAYIRYNNLFSQIPAGSFIYKATLELTASAPSTGGGYLKVGTSNATYASEATAVYTGPGAVAGRGTIAGGSLFDQLYSRNFGTSMTVGQKVEIDVAPAVRAWYDNFINPAHGYANKGLGININVVGAGGGAGSVSFFDSEDATITNHPKLTIEYLPPDSGYKAMMFTNVPVDTAQYKSVTIDDSLIRFQNPGDLSTNQSDLNFGSAPRYQLRSLVSGVGAAEPNLMPLALFRFNGLTAPTAQLNEVISLADAEFRFSGTDTWNVSSATGRNFEIRQILKDWIQGVGNGEAIEGVTFNSFNRSAGSPAVNPWEVPGALGLTDSIALDLQFLNENYEGENLKGNEAFAQMISDWIDGADNNGLALRVLKTSDGSFDLIIGQITGGHRDPYLSPAIFAVFEIGYVPEPATGWMLGMGLLVMTQLRRRKNAAA